VLRIVPTRSTNHTHLRDGFVRTVQARLTQARTAGLITADDEFAAQSPIRQLKTVFPNTPLEKGTSLDILLTAPEPNGQRALIFTGLGVVQDAWVTNEFALAYFDEKPISPPVSTFLRTKELGGSTTTIVEENGSREARVFWIIAWPISLRMMNHPLSLGMLAVPITRLTHVMDPFFTC
jgi:hypothetical protein